MLGRAQLTAKLRVLAYEPSAGGGGVIPTVVPLPIYK
jgi:hypothetical protein